MNTIRVNELICVSLFRCLNKNKNKLVEEEKEDAGVLWHNVNRIIVRKWNPPQQHEMHKQESKKAKLESKTILGYKAGRNILVYCRIYNVIIHREIRLLVKTQTKPKPSWCELSKEVKQKKKLKIEDLKTKQRI